MNLCRILFLPLLFLLPCFCVAEEEYQVASIQARLANREEIRPVAYYYLGSGEQISISFDLIRSDNVPIYYRVFRLARGNESELQPIEYSSNTRCIELFSGQPSRSTKIPYVHYDLHIPNREIALSMSGLYLLELYRSDMQGRGEGFAQIPFVVVEPKVEVSMEFPVATVVGDLETEQEVDVHIRAQDYNFMAAGNRVEVEVWKNYAEDFRLLTEPSQIRINELVYDARKSAVFAGGNEYLHYDLLDISTGSMLGIDHIERARDADHIYLPIGRNTMHAPYIYEPDMDGRQEIRSTSFGISRPELEAEYYFVHFSLDYGDARLTQDSHFALVGEAFYLQPQSPVMSIDHRSGIAKYTALIKQGYVDYAYVIQGPSGSPIHLRGEHRETTNTYTAFVFDENPQNNSYRVIGAKTMRNTSRSI
ncbi:MAG: DUF5103 domain-containing protein [Porphyromonas sp.]|nr:DUF5103 domain-containing protein [Porphyromonas sp.]